MFWLLLYVAGFFILKHKAFDMGDDTEDKAVKGFLLLTSPILVPFTLVCVLCYVVGKFVS